jgi:hypothetical protein
VLAVPTGVLVPPLLHAASTDSAASPIAIVIGRLAGLALRRPLVLFMSPPLKG